ncbi:MAG TPA: YbgC/FadM family acyl-CoA thioesterase [Candidatus Omnitrophota bacterium]|nr:YbgC/FadM family acyl-CoA thioesterase [Candidatus Omnitrophota bacterium]
MEKQIYYHDTDAGGVVYYGRYLNYLEEARTEFLQQKGLDLDLFRKNKFLYAVRSCNISYESPARYGDIIVCDAKLVKMTVARLVFDQEIREKKTGRLMVKAEVTLVSLNEDFKTTPIPEDIKSLLV